MATTAVPTDVNEQNQQPRFDTESYDLAYGFQTVVVDGKDVQKPVVLSVEEAEKLEDKFVGNVVTIKTTLPANWAGLKALESKSYQDDDGNPRDTSEVLADVVKLFNNGAKNKVSNRIKALLTKVKDGKLEFTATEFDATGEVYSGSKRVFLSQDEKTWRGLSNLPREVRLNVWKAYLSSIEKEYYVPESE